MNRIRIKVKVDELGRVTIPKIFRDALGIDVATHITCTITEDGNIVYFKEDENQEENKGE